MMKTTLAVSIAAFAALAAGCATSSAPSDAARIAKDTSAQKANIDRLCAQDTGSRIKRSDKDKNLPCAQPGSTYTEEELRDTGEFDTAEALRKLDPRIQ